MDPIKTIEKDNLKLTLHYDEDASNPRTEMDCFGTLSIWERGYDLSDPGIWANAHGLEVMAHLEESGAISLPLFLYDRGGQAKLAINGANAPNGVIFAELERVLAEFGGMTLSKEQTEIVNGLYGDAKREFYSALITPEMKEMALACLKSEVEMMNQYLNGEVYGYIVERLTPPAVCRSCKYDHGNNWEDVDSCWGFFGFESFEQEAVGVLEFFAKEERTAKRKTAKRKTTRKIRTLAKGA